MPLHDISPGLPTGYQFDYVERVDNTTVSSSATSAASGATLFTGNPFYLDRATDVWVEIAVPNVSVSSTNVLIFELFDGASDLGRLGQAETLGGGQPYGHKAKFTLAAGFHTLSIKIWTNNNSVSANTAGGTFDGCFMRVTLAGNASGGGAAGGSAGPVLVYRYTVTGSDKASIDSGADLPDAGSNDWTNGDLLEMFIIARTDEAVTASQMGMILNNDSSSIYDDEYINVSNSTVSGAPELAQAGWSFPVDGANSAANYASAMSLIFPNYAGTVFYKTGMMTRYLPDTSGANARHTVAGLGYRSTSAISRIKISAPAAQKFKVGSQLLVYKRRSS